MKSRILGTLFLVLALGSASHAADALRKMTVGQAGVNPGAGLFTIAVNQGFYKKHGLDVEIIKTNTTAAVQAMLAGKMQMATGAGAAAFVTATLGRRAALRWCASWVTCFPVPDHGRPGHQKSRRSRVIPATSAPLRHDPGTPPCASRSTGSKLIRKRR